VRLRCASLLLLAALASCARPSAREAQPLDRQAARPTIVSLNPCSDAVLTRIAAPGQLLAVSSYSHDPASSSMDVALARRFPATSGSVEEIAALAPDVVVAGSMLAPATKAALHRLGIRLVQLPAATDVAASEAQVRELAAVAGRQRQGAAMVARIEAALKRAAPPSGAQPVPAIVWESGGIVAGHDTLIADLLRRIGFADAAAARGLGQAQYLPLEAMLADPPRVILWSGNPEAREDRLLSHPALGALKDTKRARLASSLLWCGGPTIENAAARLAEVRASL